MAHRNAISLSLSHIYTHRGREESGRFERGRFEKEREGGRKGGSKGEKTVRDRKPEKESEVALNELGERGERENATYPRTIYLLKIHRCAQ